MKPRKSERHPGPNDYIEQGTLLDDSTPSDIYYTTIYFPGGYGAIDVYSSHYMNSQMIERSRDGSRKGGSTGGKEGHCEPGRRDSTRHQAHGEDVQVDKDVR